ncbi:hypothetical protein G9A89_005770 [Geosiphon pyriformis]|nr:hypothetical protein G9A89_005770 [Geosiphon pyriformis]
MPDLWTHQYTLLFDDKAANLSGISNKLWKHGKNEIMECFLGLLNAYLVVGDVPTLWKKA